MPSELRQGDDMVFTLWLGPLPVRWHARIEQLSADGFVDRQVAGPFRTWVHQHSFLPSGPSSTRVVDQVEARLRAHPLWGPVGLAMWLGLPLLFAYRGWKTRRILQGLRRKAG